MPRYIDADALKERLEIIRVVADDLYGMGINRGLDRAETEIDMQPTASVVEVVRCKDCRSWEECGIDPIANYHFGYCRHLQWQNEDDSRETNGQDFCSYGKRKE